jgi:hypothetical protein
MDIGWRNAYKHLVPQRGSVNGEVKSNGEETQERQENRSEKVAPGQYQVVMAARHLFQAPSAPESVM